MGDSGAVSSRILGDRRGHCLALPLDVNGQTGGRTVLLYAAGHLCCLAGLELCRLWAFFPGSFRPLTFLVVLGAFYTALLLAALPSRRRTPLATVLVAWASVLGFPFFLEQTMEAASLFLAGLLLAPTLVGRARGRYLALLLLLSILQFFFSLDAASTGFLLALAAAWEVTRKSSEPTWDSTRRETTRTRRDAPPRAEILWRGFPQLYAASMKGEGEKFSTQVLQDTLAVITSCSGERESGSEHRGVYRFQREADRARCRQALAEYERQVKTVLESSGAPVIELVYKED